MRLERGALTKGENIALVATIVLAALLYILGPAVYAAATGAEAAGSVVPKPGTVEYQEFMAEFEAEHGHPWNVQNEMAATKNGVLLISQLIFIVMAIALAFAFVHDLRCYAYEKNALPRDRMPAKTQLARAAFYLVLLAASVGAFLLVPLFATPVV